MRYGKCFYLKGTDMIVELKYFLKYVHNVPNLSTTFVISYNVQKVQVSILFPSGLQFIYTCYKQVCFN